MRNPLFRLILALLFVPLFVSCDLESEDTDLHHDDSGASASTTVIGNWALESLTDKTGELLGGTNRSVRAGEASTFTITSGGQSFTASFLIDGGIVFTADRYEVTLHTTMSIAGLGSNTDTTNDAGSYTLNTSTMTITSDTPNPDDPGQVVLAWSIVDGDLLLEDEESRMRFSR